MAYGAAHSRKGPVRPVNQDACCLMEALTTVGPVVMAIVCDGVGGLAQGELASSTLVSRFARWFEDSLPALLAGRESVQALHAIEGAWKSLLATANADLLVHGRATGAALATTFTGLLSYKDAFVCCHVGDCRLYRLRDGEVTQLTQDQTLVARKVDLGLVRSEEAHNHPQAGIIYQAVGACEDLEPAWTHGTIEQDDLYLLLSDGAYRRADKTLLSELFEPDDDDELLSRACQRLLAHDLEEGETDNLTAVVVRMDAPHRVGTVMFDGGRCI